MSELKRIKAEYYKAKDARRALSQKIDAEKRELVEDAAAKIDADLDAKYGSEMAKLVAAEKAASDAYDAAEVAETLTKLPFPVGTKLIGWKRTRLFSYRYGDFKKSAVGIVEVCDKDTVLPGSIIHSRPKIGDVLIRLCKKDGTPGKSVEKYRSDGGYGDHLWLPEGENPKD